MKKLVIFDLDGTLVNSLDDLADAVNRGLLNLGYPIHAVDEYKYFVGDGTRSLCERALPENARKEENVDELYMLFAEHYAVHYADKTRLYDGVSELLNQLKEKGIMIAVASNKPQFDCERVVGNLVESDLLDMVKGSKIGFPRKPSPEIVFAIMETLGVNCDETLFVGDSGVDMQTAKNAKVASVGCLWGFRDIKELEENGAEFLAQTPLDVLKYV